MEEALSVFILKWKQISRDYLLNGVNTTQDFTEPHTTFHCFANGKGLTRPLMSPQVLRRCAIGRRSSVRNPPCSFPRGRLWLLLCFHLCLDIQSCLFAHCTSRNSANLSQLGIQRQGPNLRVPRLVEIISAAGPVQLFLTHSQRFSLGASRASAGVCLAVVPRSARGPGTLK